MPHSRVPISKGLYSKYRYSRVSPSLPSGSGPVPGDWGVWMGLVVWEAEWFHPGSFVLAGTCLTPTAVKLTFNTLTNGSLCLCFIIDTPPLGTVAAALASFLEHQRAWDYKH